MMHPSRSSPCCTLATGDKLLYNGQTLLPSSNSARSLDQKQEYHLGWPKCYQILEINHIPEETMPDLAKKAFFTHDPAKFLQDPARFKASSKRPFLA